MAGIKIDDISCTGATTIYHPVVSVEWSRISMHLLALRHHRTGNSDKPKEHLPSCFQASLVGLPFEVDKFDTPTSLATSPRLPLHHFCPSALVDGIMYWYNSLHIRGLRVVIFSSHSSKELRFRWVNPISIGRSRNGGCFAFRG